MKQCKPTNLPGLTLLGLALLIPALHGPILLGPALLTSSLHGLTFLGPALLIPALHGLTLLSPIFTPTLQGLTLPGSALLTPVLLAAFCQAFGVSPWLCFLRSGEPLSSPIILCSSHCPTSSRLGSCVWDQSNWPLNAQRSAVC